MKKMTMIIMFFLFLTTAFSQTAMSLLNQLPQPPADACGMSEEEKRAYLSKVNKVLKTINERISEIKKAQENKVAIARNQIEKKLADEHGLSAADVQKLKNKKLSKEEKKAIADKMMQEKTGISVSEIDKLKKMSKEGKKQWAEAYATQQQANLSGGQDSDKTEEQIEMEKKQKINMSTVNLSKEQKLLVDKIAATDKKYFNKMKELQKKDSIQQIILNKRLEPINKKLNALPGPSEEEAFELCKQRHSFEIEYCNMLTPDYIKMLKELSVSVTTLLPDYRRLGEINAELNKAMLGNDLKSSESDELLELQAVEGYANNLRSSFKYALRSSCRENYEDDK